MPNSVWKVIEEIGAEPVAPDQQYRVRMHGDTWDFECGGVQLRDLPRPALAGEHQVGNAAAALAAVVAGGFSVRLDHATVSAALRGAQVAGRFQRVAGEVEWILDVAHNVPAAETLRDNLRRLPPASRTLAICGILGDKDIRGITARLAADVDAWILTSLEGARAVSTQHIAEALPPGATVLAHAHDVAEACRVARAAARPGERVLVFGSFLTVGPALEFLGI